MKRQSKILLVPRLLRHVFSRDLIVAAVAEKADADDNVAGKSLTGYSRLCG